MSANVTDYSQEIIVIIDKTFLSLNFLIGLIITVFNSVFIVAVVATESVRTVENALLVKLSCFDVIAGLSVLVNCSAEVVMPVAYNVCMASALLLGTSFLGSVFSLLDITIERYIKVTHPFVYLRVATKRTMAVFMTTEVVFLLLLIGGFLFVGYEASRAEFGNVVQTRCLPLRFSDVTFVGRVMSYVTLGIPLVVSTVAYLRMACIARKQRITIRSLTVASESASSGQSTDGRFGERKYSPDGKRLNMVGIILSLHYISLVPMLLNNLIVMLADISPTYAIVSAFIRQLSTSFVYLNSVMNPVIYPYRNPDIRMAIKRLLKMSSASRI